MPIPTRCDRQVIPATQHAQHCRSLQAAVQLHQAGDLARAEQITGQCAAKARNAHAWHLLGMVALQVGNFNGAGRLPLAGSFARWV